MSLEIVLVAPTGHIVPPPLPFLLGVWRSNGMEDEDQHSLDAHEYAKDVLSWEVDLAWQAARSDQPKGPSETKQQRENDGDEKMFSYH